jgi:hypothetical protein
MPLSVSIGKPRTVNIEFSLIRLLLLTDVAGSYANRSFAVVAIRSSASSLVTTWVENGVSTCLRVPSAPALTLSDCVAGSTAAVTVTAGSVVTASDAATVCAQPGVDSVESERPALANSAALRSDVVRVEPRTNARWLAVDKFCMFFWSSAGTGRRPCSMTARDASACSGWLLSGNRNLERE